MDIFKLVGSIYVDADKANESLQKTGENAEKTGGKLGKIVEAAGGMALGVGAAAGAAGAALFGMAKNASDNLDEIQKGAQQLDISYESYQKLSYAAERSGTSIDSLSKGIKNITNDMADIANGTDYASTAFADLGVSVTNADGSMKSNEQVLNDTLMALADMEDTTQRNAIANDIFGSSYQDLAPLLNSGSEGIKDMMQNAEELGLVMSDDAVEAGAAFGDQLADVKDSLGAVATQVGSAVMPIISKLLQWVLDHMPEIQETISKVTDWIVNDAIPVVIKIIDAVSPVVESAFKLIKKYWNNILKPVIDTIISLFNGDFKNKITGAFDSIKDKASSVFNGLISIVKSPINTIIGYLNTFIRGINALKIPDWVPAVGGKSANLSTIPYLAKGGNIIEGGATIVGERGPELLDLPVGARVTPLKSQDALQSGEMVGLLERIGDLLEAIRDKDENYQIRMSSGALVGELAPAMDAALGRLAIKNARGVK